MTFKNSFFWLKPVLEFVHKIDFSPKTSATPSTSFENQSQSETMNNTENAIFENSMNNSTTQAQNVSEVVTSPDRTSTPVPGAESIDQNHCGSESRTSTTPPSPGREKSPSWEQQTNTNSNSADNDANDSEVRRNYCNQNININDEYTRMFHTAHTH